MKYYLCYDSEVTPCTFAIKEVEEGYVDSNPHEYFVLSEKECIKEKVYSRIKGVSFRADGQ